MDTDISNSNRETFCSEYRSFYLWLLQVFFLLALIALCLWLSLRTKSPYFTLVGLTLPTLNGTDAGGSTLLMYELDIENPNQDSGIYYDDVLMTFYSGVDAFASDVLPSFYQGKGKSFRLRDNANANDLQVWSRVMRSISNATTTKLEVRLATQIRYKRWGKKSKLHGISAGGVVAVDSSGKIAGKKKKKKVKLRQHSPGKSKRK